MSVDMEFERIGKCIMAKEKVQGHPATFSALGNDSSVAIGYIRD